MSAAPAACVARRALRVAVIGAGPVGLAAALHLRASDLPVELQVFDAAADARAAQADPRVLALSAASRQWLAQIGGWPDAAATAITRIHVSQHAAGLAALPSTVLAAADAALPALGYTLRYGVLLQALRAAADRAGIAVQHGVAVRAENQGGWVRLRDAGGADLGAADLALLAEGGAFHTQPARPLRRDYGQTALIGRAVMAQPHAGWAFERFTAGGPIALLPHDGADAPPGRSHALVWCVPPAQAQALRARPADEQLQRLQALLPPRAGRVHEVRLHADFPLGMNALAGNVRGRVVHLGNAAQTLHPVAGQGLNLGLRDAAALVEALRAVAAQPTAVETALQCYGAARWPDRAGLLLFTDALALGFAWRAPGLAALRAAALAGLQALPPLRLALTQRMVWGWRG